MQTLADPPPVPVPQSRLTGIPTDDPQAALQFCRWLAANLAAGIPEVKGLPDQGVESLQEGPSTKPGREKRN